MISRVGGLALLLAGLGACDPAPVAKSSPTWEADVFPILQGRCLHCHGGTANENGAMEGQSKGYRFDFLDFSLCKDNPDDPDMGEPVKAAFSSYPFNGFEDLIAPADGSRGTMPPAPASTLQEWEVQTIKNWVSKNKPRGSRGKDNKDNHPPKIIITSKLPNDVGDELKVSYRFEDTDADPVIGVLKLGDAKADLLKNSGEVTIKGITGSSGDKLTLSADLCDGWKKVSQDNLGEIKRQ